MSARREGDLLLKSTHTHTHTHRGINPVWARKFPHRSSPLVKEGVQISPHLSWKHTRHARCVSAAEKPSLHRRRGNSQRYNLRKNGQLPRRNRALDPRDNNRRRDAKRDSITRARAHKTRPPPSARTDSEPGEDHPAARELLNIRTRPERRRRW